MPAFAVCPDFLREVPKADSLYYREVLAKFYEDIPPKVALDRNGGRAIEAYSEIAKQERGFGVDVSRWIHLLASAPDQNLEYVDVDPAVVGGRPFFMRLAAAITNHQRLIAWSDHHYATEAAYHPTVTILDRDKARECLMANTQPLPGFEGATIEGDVFLNVSDSKIVNRSRLRDSMIEVTGSYGPAAAEGLHELAQLVSSPGNEAAQAVFEQFRKEVEAEEPDKALLQNLWNGLNALLPAAEKLVDIGAKLTPLLT